MPDTVTLSVELTRDVTERLTRLAGVTRRDRAALAGEAIAAFVARELDVVEGIARGLDDVTANRLVPHDAAMARLHATIANSERHRR